MHACCTFRIGLLVLLGGACGACGPDVPPPPRIIVSGSRLAARYQEAAEARRFIGWRDTATGRDCSFDPFIGPGRAHRCVAGTTVRRSEVYFTDPQCQVPAMEATTVSDPAWALLQPDDTCASSTQILSIAGPLPDPIYSTILSSCDP